jgi:hypothetical protein
MSRSPQATSLEQVESDKRFQAERAVKKKLAKLIRRLQSFRHARLNHRPIRQ